MSHSCSGDASRAGDLRLIGNLLGFEEMFQPDGQRHQLGNVRQTRWVWRLDRLRLSYLLLPMFAASDLELGLDVIHDALSSLV